MTQVSKKWMREQIEDKVYETFWESCAKLTKREEIELFFNDLFTRAERINFTKRLSIAVLLYQGYDWRQISDLLKVSVATVGRIVTRTSGPGFKLFFEKMEKEESWRAFWKDLAKTYLLVTHPDKYARLGEEGVERVYFRKKEKTFLEK